MDIKRLYGYSVQDLATGIVLADSVEEATVKSNRKLNSNASGCKLATD